MQEKLEKVFFNHKNIFFSQYVRTILVTKYHSSLSSVPFWIQNPNTVSIAYFIVQQNLQSSHLPDAGLIAVTNQLHYILCCVKLDYSVFTV